jgi:sulfide:quinone oxidoreductase
MSSHRHPKVIVAGGGVAAIETLLALRAQLNGMVELDLVTTASELTHRPTTVAEPFGLKGPPPIPLADLTRSLGVTLHSTALREARPAQHQIRTADGALRDYDVLVVATGARWIDAVPGATTFRGEQGVAAVRAMLDAVVRDPGRRLGFVAPRTGWTLPIYELALMSAARVREAGVESPRITVTTPESEPLELFGPTAAEAVRQLLAAAGIELHCGTNEPPPADDVVALPAASGPFVRGLPSDAAGFLETDAHSAVLGADAVYAAGDVTAFPVKQGGLATQQADAVAEGIAHRLGALRTPAPFRPVLRGILLTGDAPLYLRSELAWAHGAPLAQVARRLPRRGVVSGGALWWPPAKLAGRHLAGWLAGGGETLVDRPASQRAPDHERAGELALLMADVAAEDDDIPGALHALESAASLSGGVLPAPAAARRDAWRARVRA